MIVSSLQFQELAARLASQGVVIPCGPFAVRICSALAAVARGFHGLYADFPVLADDRFTDFVVSVDSPSLLRRYLRPQVTFSCDGRVPFKPLPLSQAFPMLEWGLNWVISSHAHEYLVIHAAVVERDGDALLLAADPGSGKSTLCAALVQAGWRLLSDELALVDLASGEVRSIARPISLKNKSIGIVRSLDPSLVFSDTCPDTAKGDIAHLRPPPASVAHIDVPARPRQVIFPKYVADSPLAGEAVGKAHALVELVRHAFNYPMLGATGFDAMVRLLDAAAVHRLRYSSFDQVLPEIDRLWTAGEGAR